MSRFNLRSRRSLKLTTQTQCEQCQRYFFTREYDGSDSENRQICVDCEESANRSRKRVEAPPVKKPTPATVTPAKRIKKERIDPDYNVERAVSSSSDEASSASSSDAAVKAFGHGATNRQFNVYKHTTDRETGGTVIKIEPADPNASKRTHPPITIPKSESVETLRTKYPKASPYEMEFMMFLSKQ